MPFRKEHIKRIFDLGLQNNFGLKSKKEYFFYFGLNFFGVLNQNPLAKSIFTSIVKISDNFIEKFRSKDFGQNSILRLYG